MPKTRDAVDRPKRGCAGNSIAIVVVLGALAAVGLCNRTTGLSPADATRAPATVVVRPTATPTPDLIDDVIVSPAIVTPAPTTAAPIPTTAPAPPAVRGGNEVNPFTCAGGCSEPPDPSCAIKGNISQSSGEKIYHRPGQRNYDDTEISPEFGERWFCTEAEAVAAGWRAAKR